MSHQAQVPGPIADYFGTGRRPYFEDHPIITRQFKPDTGWTRYPIVKRVSTAWLRKMRGEGVESVEVAHAGRHADFTLDEILGRRKRR
jgi:hypothetical protein